MNNEIMMDEKDFRRMDIYETRLNDSVRKHVSLFRKEIVRLTLENKRLRKKINKYINNE